MCTSKNNLCIIHVFQAVDLVTDEKGGLVSHVITLPPSSQTTIDVPVTDFSAPPVSVQDNVEEEQSMPVKNDPLPQELPVS